MATNTQIEFDSTDSLSDPCKQGLRNILMACGDTKLLLGYHYGEWTFGTPELEAAVASCSLAQSELGHVRLIQAVLKKHYGDDPDKLVDERPANRFANISYLDAPIADWAGFIAANYVVDMAVTRILHSLRGSAFKPLRMSVEKMLDEERYHIHHGQGWVRMLAAKDRETKKAVQNKMSEALASVVEWFGPPEHEEDVALVEADIKSKRNEEILKDFLGDVGETAKEAGIKYDVERPDSFDSWNPETRRSTDGGPQEEILYHLKGSKNEVFKPA